MIILRPARSRPSSPSTISSGSPSSTRFARVVDKIRLSKGSSILENPSPKILTSPSPCIESARVGTPLTPVSNGVPSSFSLETPSDITSTPALTSSHFTTSREGTNPSTPSPTSVKDQNLRLQSPEHLWRSSASAQYGAAQSSLRRSNPSTVFRRVKSRRTIIGSQNSGKFRRSPKAKSRSPPRSRRVKKAADIYEAKIAALKPSQTAVNGGNKPKGRKKVVQRLPGGRIIFVDANDKENMDLPSEDAVKDNNQVGYLSPLLLQPENYKGPWTSSATPVPFVISKSAAKTQTPPRVAPSPASPTSLGSTASSFIVDSLKRCRRSGKVVAAASLLDKQLPSLDLSRSRPSSNSLYSTTADGDITDDESLKISVQSSKHILSSCSPLASGSRIPLAPEAPALDQEWVVLPPTAELKGSSKREKVKRLFNRVVSTVTPPKVCITNRQIKKEIAKVTVPPNPAFRLRKPKAQHPSPEILKNTVPATVIGQGPTNCSTFSTAAAMEKVVEVLEANLADNGRRRPALPSAWLRARH